MLLMTCVLISVVNLLSEQMSCHFSLPCEVGDQELHQPEPEGVRGRQDPDQRVRDEGEDPLLDQELCVFCPIWSYYVSIEAIQDMTSIIADYSSSRPEVAGGLEFVEGY